MTEEERIELLTFVELHDKRHILDKTEFSKQVVEQTKKRLRDENESSKRI